MGLLLVTTMLFGCFSMPRTLPEAPPKAVSFAQEPQPGNQLDALSRELLAGHPEEESGFLMLSNNAEALRWRLLLADMAEETLDMQYYLWNRDASANLLLDHVIRAADRGVRIRLLVDDITLMGRDRGIAALSRHPQIEIRLFNPIENRNQSTFIRAMEFAGKIKQLNHRMHNKLMVADNRLGIVGGRNIGNEYFGLNPKQNFVDFDVLAVGEIVPRIAFSFDLFWNSDGAYPGEGLIQNHPDPDLLDKLLRTLDEGLADQRDLLIAFVDESLDAERMLDTLRREMYTGTADVIYDRPLVGGRHAARTADRISEGADPQGPLRNSDLDPLFYSHRGNLPDLAGPERPGGAHRVPHEFAGSHQSRNRSQRLQKTSRTGVRYRRHHF